MQIQAVDRSDPEKVFITVNNVSGNTITTGMAVAFAYGNSFDGISAVLPASGTAANLPGFCGIAVSDIANNGYGRVQSYGVNGSIMLSNVATSITINAGDPLIPSALGGALTSTAPTYANSGLRYVIASSVPSNTLSQAAPLYCAGFIRCL